MYSKKALSDKSAEKVLKRAGDCFTLAEKEHRIAERQHEIASMLEVNAGKLEALGHALESDAVEIKGNTQVVARGIPIPKELAAGPVASRGFRGASKPLFN
jgi:hypothetical protein